MTLAALAAVAIFGASASAASVSEGRVATDLLLSETSAAVIASPVDPTEEPDGNVVGTDEVAGESAAADAVVAELDLEALAETNSEALLEARRIVLSESEAAVDVLVDSNRSLGIEASPNEVEESPADELAIESDAADDADVTVEVLGDVDQGEVDVEQEVETGAAPVSETDDPVDISAIVPDGGSVIADLSAERQAALDAEAAAAEAAAEEQAAADLQAASQQAASRTDLSIGEQAAVLARELGTPSNEAEAQAAWDAGYLLGGGANLSAFHNTIIPCESGGQPNRDSVVGFTDDWGRAQINRPVWSSTFRDLTGVAFEEGVVLPTLNGFIAAHIEQVQGLSAWTCWRNR